MFFFFCLNYTLRPIMIPLLREIQGRTGEGCLFLFIYCSFSRLGPGDMQEMQPRVLGCYTRTVFHSPIFETASRCFPGTLIVLCICDEPMLDLARALVFSFYFLSPLSPLSFFPLNPLDQSYIPSFVFFLSCDYRIFRKNRLGCIQTCSLQEVHSFHIMSLLR